MNRHDKRAARKIKRNREQTMTDLLRRSKLGSTRQRRREAKHELYLMLHYT